MLKASILSVYLMALLYIAAGVNHFVHPAFYEKMIANFLPDTDLIVKIITCDNERRTAGRNKWNERQPVR